MASGLGFLVGRYWSWDFPLALDFRLARYPVFWLVAAEIEGCFFFPWDNCTLFYLLLAVAGAGIPRAGGLFPNGWLHCSALSASGTRDVLPLLRECCGFPLAGVWLRRLGAVWSGVWFFE